MLIWDLIIMFKNFFEYYDDMTTMMLVAATMMIL